MRLVEGRAVGDPAVVREQAADTALVVVHDVGREPTGEGEQLVVRHDVVDEPELPGLLRIEEVAGEGHLDRAAQADRLGQQDGDASSRHDPDAGVRVDEPGVLRRDEERALQRDLEDRRWRRRH